MAGVRAPADEIDCAEVCDAFSGAQIQAVETLGLAPEGGEGPARRERAAAAAPPRRPPATCPNEAPAWGCPGV